MKQDKRFLKDIEASKVLVSDGGGLFSGTTAEDILSENRGLINSNENTLTGHTGDTSIHFTKGSINLSELGSSAHTHTTSEITDFPTNVSTFTNDAGYLTGATGGVDTFVSGTTFSASTGILEFTNTTGGTFNTNLDDRYFKIDGSDTVTGNMTVSTDGSTKANPRTLGFTNLSTGEAMSIDFGDEFNALRSGHGNGTILYSFHTLYFKGGTELNGSGQDVSVDALNDAARAEIHIIQQPDRSISFRAAAVQTAPIITFENSSVTTLSGVDNNGKFFGDGSLLSGITTVTGSTFSASTGILEFTNITGGTFNVDLGYTSGDTTNWDVAYDDSITGMTVTGTTTKTITLEQRGGSVIQANFTDMSGGAGGDAITGATFDTGTGDLDLNSTGSTITVNLDNRYSLTGHTHVVSDITDFPTDLSAFTNSVGYLTGATGGIDTFVSGTTFDTGTGILEFTNTTGGTFNVDLDGRYTLSATTTITETLVSSGGETQWALSSTPSSEYPIYLFNENIYLVKDKDWGLSADTITFSGTSTPLTSGETVTIYYNSNSSPLSQLEALQTHTGDTSIHYTKASINLSDLGTTGHTHDFSGLTNTGHTHTKDILEINDVTSSRNLLSTDIGTTLVSSTGTGSTISIISGFTDMLINQYVNLEAHATTLTISGATEVLINGVSGGTKTVGNGSQYVGGLLRKKDTNSYIIL